MTYASLWQVSRKGLTIGFLILMVLCLATQGQGVSNAFNVVLWLAVVFFALKFGTRIGLAFVATVTITQAVFAGSSLAAHVDFYSFLAANLNHALAWILAVTMIGVYRRLLVDKIESWQDQAGELRTKATTLTRHCEALRAEVARLERQITCGAVIDTARCVVLLDSLEYVDEDELEHAFRDAAALIVGADELELAILVNGRWNRPWNFPAPRESCREREVGQLDKARQRVFDVVSRENRRLWCTRPADAEVLDSYAAGVVPVKSAQGQLLGILAFRRVDPDALSAAGEAALSLIATVLARRLERLDKSRSRYLEVSGIIEAAE